MKALAPDLSASIARVAGWALEHGYTRSEVASALLDQAARQMDAAPESERVLVGMDAYRAADLISKPEDVE